MSILLDVGKNLEKTKNAIEWIEENVIQKDSKDRKFILLNWQKQLIKSFFEEQFVVINKCRQAGATSVFISLAVYLALHYDRYSILFATPNLNVSNLVSNYIVKNVALHTKYSCTTVQNSILITLENDSKITIDSKPCCNSSNKYNLFLLDEAAFIRNVDKFNNSYLTTRIIVDSQVPYGFLVNSTEYKYDINLNSISTNWFKRFWEFAKEDSDTFDTIKVVETEDELIDLDDIKSTYTFDLVFN